MNTPNEKSRKLPNSPFRGLGGLKRAFGLLWILLGPLAIFYLIRTAADQITKKPELDTKIQWGVFVVVFIPIAIGMILFGYYALKGEYDNDKATS
ncbi:DUF6814 family protein [Flavitalea flava]